MSGTSWELLAEGKALWTVSSGAGGTIDAGLPNIKGQFSLKCPNDGSRLAPSATNVFSLSDGDTKINAMKVEGTKVPDIVIFNASNYNSIYSDSISTVQPPAIKVYAYKRVS